MKTLKSLFATVSVLFCSIAVSANPIEIGGIWYNLQDSQAEVTSGDTRYSYTVVIPSSVVYDGMEFSVTSIGAAAFKGCSGLAAVVIPASVKTIGANAFAGCNRISSITIPQGVEEIGRSAFANCSNLSRVDLPEGITEIKESTFSLCGNLASIDIPKGCTSIGEGAFSQCSKLSSITIPEGVINIGESVFFDCKSLQSITLPNSVSNMGYGVFRNCSSLASFTIPDSMKNIGSYAFSGCSGLMDVYVKDINVWCNIEFGGYESNPLVNGGNLYLNGESVTELIIPDGITVINKYAFEGFSNLTSVILPSGLISINEGAFYECSRLTSITIPESVTSIGNDAFGFCSSLTLFEIPQSVTSIEGSAFRHCSSLTSINIPEGVISIGASTFSNCVNLISVTIPSSVTSVGYHAFYCCESLKDVYCYAQNVPTTDYKSFEETPQDITLHVPAGSIERYKRIVPWSFFGKIEAIKVPVEEITLDKTVATLEEGKTLTLCATVIPEDATDASVVWSSSNEEVATVDEEGNVTAIAPGTATITVTSNESGEVSASCEVAVVPARYVITYLVDDEVFATDTLTRGILVEVIDEPVKEGYTFSGWSEVPETMPAENITISGTFTVNKYLATFKIDDEVITSDSLEYGAAIVVPDTPKREGYTFSGWSEIPETMPAEDITIIGTFAVNKYLVTFKIGDGVIASDSLEYGADIVAPEVPEKEGYTFREWSGMSETMPAEDITITGIFTANKYLVTFKIGDEVIASDSLEYGADIVSPEASEKEGYTFNGWGEVAKTVPASNVTYTGSYTANVYKVYYYVDGKLVYIAEVTYGEALPEYVYEPTVEDDVFMGWMGDTYETMPAHDVIYTANIVNGIEQITNDNSQMTIYDLQGRRVLDVENMKAGLYIVNGHKVLIK